MSPVSLEGLSVNEEIPTRSRTFSPEVVQRVRSLFAPTDGSEPAKNVGIGTFEKEGGARSALASLNRLLVEQFQLGSPYASTVRATEDGKYKAILLNRAAKAKPAPAAAAAPADKPAASGAKTK